MGKEIADQYPAARQIFQEADDLLRLPLSKLCFEGPETELNETLNTQPALFVCSLATLAALRAEIPDATPAMMAGHSFGQITALVAAGALSFADGLYLVRERGKAMMTAGQQQPGAMAALLGLDMARAGAIGRSAGDAAGGGLVVAKSTGPAPSVRGGAQATLALGMQRASEAGARRVIRLAVSIAAHSPLMQPAAILFRSALSAVQFVKPTIPVYSSVTAQPVVAADRIAQELEQQLLQPVLWTGVIERMLADGARTFVEIGPRDVLTGLIKRIERSAVGLSLNGIVPLAQLAQDARST